MLPTDTYRFVVALDDGSVIEEASDVGMALVPIDRVRRLDVLLNPDAFPDTSPPVPLFSVALGPHQTLIWFRDRRIGLDSAQVAAAPDGAILDGPRRVAATVFGWKTDVNGRTASTYVWLSDDGPVLITDHDIRFYTP